jgi:ferredoxin
MAHSFSGAFAFSRFSLCAASIIGATVMPTTPAADAFMKARLEYSESAIRSPFVNRLDDAMSGEYLKILYHIQAGCVIGRSSHRAFHACFSCGVCVVSCPKGAPLNRQVFLDSCLARQLASP